MNFFCILKIGENYKNWSRISKEIKKTRKKKKEASKEAGNLH